MRVIVLLCVTGLSSLVLESEPFGFPTRAILDRVEPAPGYALVKGALQREHEFRDFAEALAFVNRVAELAERENHHPDIEIHWNRVTLRWWTHVKDAVTDRDFELAEKANSIL
jgi:4a-hydroxytetrahydrobiopterin dehydratase